MNGTVILYKSKYGAAKKYAELLGAELSCSLLENSGLHAEQVGEYDNIVLCGGIYASGVAGISFLKKNYDALKEKNIVVFAVGASPYDEKIILELKQRNLAGELSGIPLFYGRGAWDEEGMSWMDRTLCGMLKKSVKKKDPNLYEPWEKALVEAFGKKCDWVDIKYLKPAIEYLQIQ